MVSLMVVRTILTLGATAILARLLTPADYGSVASGRQPLRCARRERRRATRSGRRPRSCRPGRNSRRRLTRPVGSSTLSLVRLK